MNLAARDFTPVDRKLCDVTACVSQGHHQVHVEGKTHEREPVLDGFEYVARDHFAAALGVIDGYVEQLGNERCIDASDEMPVKEAMNTAPQHFDPGGEPCVRGNLLSGGPDRGNQPGNLGGGHGPICIGERQPLLTLMGRPTSIHRAPFPNVLRQSQHRAYEWVGAAVLIDQRAKFPGFIFTTPVVHDKDGDPANIPQHLTEVREKGAETGALAKAGNDE